MVLDKLVVEVVVVVGGGTGMTDNDDWVTFGLGGGFDTVC